MAAAPAAPQPYYVHRLRHGAKPVLVKFYTKQQPDTTPLYEGEKVYETHENIAIVFDEHGVMFGLTQIGAPPHKRKSTIPFPQRQEKYLLEALKQRLASGAWKRGKAYCLSEDWRPDIQTHGQVRAGICQKLNLQPEDLDNLAPVMLHPHSATDRTRDHIARDYGFLTTEPLGRQLADIGVLTRQEAWYLDHWPDPDHIYNQRIYN